MGRQIAGHGDCLVCHPDLDRKYAKNCTKGLKRVKPSVRRHLQEDVDAVFGEALCMGDNNG